MKYEKIKTLSDHISAKAFWFSKPHFGAAASVTKTNSSDSFCQNNSGSLNFPGGRIDIAGVEKNQKMIITGASVFVKNTQCNKPIMLEKGLLELDGAQAGEIKDTPADANQKTTPNEASEIKKSLNIKNSDFDNIYFHNKAIVVCDDAKGLSVSIPGGLISVNGKSDVRSIFIKNGMIRVADSQVDDIFAGAENECPSVLIYGGAKVNNINLKSGTLEVKDAVVTNINSDRQTEIKLVGSVPVQLKRDIVQADRYTILGNIDAPFSTLTISVERNSRQPLVKGNINVKNVILTTARKFVIKKGDNITGEIVFKLPHKKNKPAGQIIIQKGGLFNGKCAQNHILTDKNKLCHSELVSESESNRP